MTLRQQLRQRRNTISPSYRDFATQEITQKITLLPEFIAAQFIAGYSAFDGEIDALPLLHIALQQKKHCFLPRIHQDINETTMEFVEFHSLTELTRNPYGILEPINPYESFIAPEKLEVVLTPLVGFDAKAHRLGMGRGYYDRCFKFLHNPSFIKKPFLIGLAFDCQFVAEFPVHENDIQLDMIVTESKVLLP